MFKSGDQRTVTNVTLFDNRLNHTGYGCSVGSKTTEQNVYKATFFPLCRSLHILSGNDLLFVNVTYFKYKNNVWEFNLQQAPLTFLPWNS